MPLDPTVVNATNLNNRFRLDPGYTRNQMLRDLRDMIEQINARLLQLEAMVEDHEARLTAGGH
jgi:hypothetical protein